MKEISFLLSVWPVIYTVLSLSVAGMYKQKGGIDYVREVRDGILLW